MRSFRFFSFAKIVSMGAWQAAVLASILLVAPSASSQTEVQADWIDATGRYSVATNWSAGTVPNNDSSSVYSVVINQGRVVSDQDATINALTIGVNGTLADSGQGVVSPATITTGTMVNEGFVHYEQGSVLNVSGVVINSGGIVMGLHGARATLGDTYNSGSMVTSALGGSITVNGTLTNTGVVFTGLRLFVNGDLINDGTVTTDSPTGFNQISGNLCNNKNSTYFFGSLDVISGIVHNHGTMNTYPTHLYGTNIGSLDNDGVLLIHNRFGVGDISNSGTIGLGGMVGATTFTQNNAGIWQEASGPLGFGTVGATDYISLDGTLDLSPLASVHFTLGQSFDLATFPPGNLDGSFSTIVGNSFNSGTLMLQINYDGNAGRIRLTVVPAGSQEVVFTP